PTDGRSARCGQRSNPRPQSLRERRVAKLPLRIVFVIRLEHADAPHAVALLRPRRERPCRRAAKSSDECSSCNGGGHLPAPVLEPKTNDTMIGWLYRADHTTRCMVGCSYGVMD